MRGGRQTSPAGPKTAGLRTVVEESKELHWTSCWWAKILSWAAGKGAECAGWWGAGRPSGSARMRRIGFYIFFRNYFPVQNKFRKNLENV